MWCDTGQVLPWAGSQQFAEVSLLGGASLLGSLPGPKDQAVFSRRLFSAIKLGFCILSFTPQQHSVVPRSGHPSDPSPFLECPSGPQPTLLSFKAPPLGITLSWGALCGSTHAASYPRRVATSPRAHASLSLSLCVDFRGFMYVSVITTCYRFRDPPCRWPWAGSE